MPAAKRTPDQMLADALLIEELRVKGWELREIAAHISSIRSYKIGHTQVFYDLKKSEELWRVRTVELRQRGKDRLLREVDLVRKTAWRMLEKSAEEQVKVRAELQGQTAGEATKSPPVKITRENMAQYGDPALLRVILDCNRREAQILGLDEDSGVKLTAGDDVVGPTAQETRVVLYLPRKSGPTLDVDEVKPKTRRRK